MNKALLVLLSFAFHFCLVLFFFHFGLFSHFLLPFIKTFTSYINSMYSLLTILCECEKSHYVFINHLYYIVCTFSNINERKIENKNNKAFCRNILLKHTAYCSLHFMCILTGNLEKVTSIVLFAITF